MRVNSYIHFPYYFFFVFVFVFEMRFYEVQANQELTVQLKMILNLLVIYL